MFKSVKSVLDVITRKKTVAASVGLTAAVTAAVGATVALLHEPRTYPVVWKTHQSVPAPKDVVASVTGAKGKGKGRAPAAIGGPSFVVEDGVLKLVIELDFLCSSWLFLAAPGPMSNPDTYSDTRCKEIAALQTETANRVYRNSKIPVKFVATRVMTEPRKHWVQMEGRYNSLDEVKARVATALPIPQGSMLDAGHVNNTDWLVFPNIMPAVKVLDYSTRLDYHAPVSVVNTASRTTLPTRGQSVVPYTVACRNPSSTTRISNFEKTWGVNSTAWFRGATGICGTCTVGVSSYAYRLSPSTNPYGGTQVCEVVCPCLAYQANNNQYVWDPHRGQCGTYPGDRDAPSDVNECGYQIQQTAQYWTSNVYTKFLPPNLYERPEALNLFNWAYSQRGLTDYWPKENQYKILVMVRPTANGGVYGSAAGIAKLRARTIESVLFGQEIDLPAPFMYFMTTGALVLTANAPDNDTLAHEIGHILGGWHDAASVERIDPELAAWLRKEKIGAFFDPFKGYSTIMGANPFAYIPYFSSRTMIAGDGRSLGRMEDNRLAIIETLNYLAGRKLGETATLEQRVNGIINSLLLKLK